MLSREVGSDAPYDAVSLSLSLSLQAIAGAISALIVLGFADSARAQSDPFWDGPYTFAPATTPEIEHAALIGKPGPHQGKVVLIRDHVNSGVWLWNPAAPNSVEILPSDTQNWTNMACGGMSWDAKGDWIVAGGDKLTTCGSEPTWTHVFEPDTSSFLRYHDMLVPSPLPPRFGYYYPTTLALHDGRVLAVGGGSAPWRPNCGPEPAFLDSNFWQVYDKAAGRWDGLIPGQTNGQPLPGLPTGFQFTAYPRLFLLSTGDLFHALSYNSGLEPVAPPQRMYSPSAFTSVASIGTSWPPPAWQMHPFAARKRDAQGRTVNLVYPTAAVRFFHVVAPNSQTPSQIRDEVIVIGGWDAQPQLWPGPGTPPSLPASASERLAEDGVWHVTNPLGGGTWQRNPYGSLHHRRVFANVVVTPDLQLVLLGGTQNYYSPGKDVNDPVEPAVAPIPVFDVETFDLLIPGSGWRAEQQPHTSYRGYHSVALQLPCGRIVHGSGWRNTVNQMAHTDVEIYTPPSLQPMLPRPAIVSAPATLAYGAPIPDLEISLSDPTAFGVQTAADAIDFVSLIRCGSVTHHFDADQRCIRLDVAVRTSNKTFTVAPLPTKVLGGHFIAPPGWYMLFVVTKPDPQSLPQRRIQVPSVARFVKIEG